MVRGAGFDQYPAEDDSRPWKPVKGISAEGVPGLSARRLVAVAKSAAIVILWDGALACWHKIGQPGAM